MITFFLVPLKSNPKERTVIPISQMAQRECFVVGDLVFGVFVPVNFKCFCTPTSSKMRSRSTLPVVFIFGSVNKRKCLNSFKIIEISKIKKKHTHYYVFIGQSIMIFGDKQKLQ